MQSDERMFLIELQKINQNLMRIANELEILNAGRKADSKKNANESREIERKQRKLLFEELARRELERKHGSKKVIEENKGQDK